MQLLDYPSGSQEPVTVAEALVACRIDAGSSLEPQLAAIIEAARLQAEHITGRTYRAQVLREVAGDWPALLFDLPVASASSVAISYRSSSAPDNWATLAPAVYRFSSLEGRTLIRLAAGQTWPDLAPDDYPDRVRVDVTAAAATPMPATVRTYILACVASWVEQPAALVDGRLQANPLHERLLDGERLWH